MHTCIHTLIYTCTHTHSCTSSPLPKGKMEFLNEHSTILSEPTKQTHHLFRKKGYFLSEHTNFFFHNTLISLLPTHASKKYPSCKIALLWNSLRASPLHSQVLSPPATLLLSFRVYGFKKEGKKWICCVLVGVKLGVKEKDNLDLKIKWQTCQFLHTQEVAY